MVSRDSGAVTLRSFGAGASSEFCLPFRPLMRALVDGPKRRLGAALLPFRARWNIRGRRLLPKADPDQAVIRAAAFVRATIGIGEGARLMIDALRLAGYRVQVEDLSAMFGLNDALAPLPSDEGPSDTCIVVLNPPELLSLALRRPEVLRCRRVIGYWSWELEAMPRAWDPAFALVDEVWCQSAFTADAIRRRAPEGLPVVVVPHPVDRFATPLPDRARLGLPADRVLVLMGFDVNSTVARKNPQAALEAFRLATRDLPGQAVLVCKVTGWERSPDLFDGYAARDDVIFIRDRLSDEDMAILINSCDIALSLHRAEGFGLMPARAMMMGKAVVATGWSGNLQFMDDQSAALTPYVLTPVDDAQGIYREGVWAEPNVQAAARQLRALIVDPAARASLGQAARQRMRDLFNSDRFAALAIERLGEPPPRR